MSPEWLLGRGQLAVTGQKVPTTPKMLLITVVFERENQGLSAYE